MMLRLFLFIAVCLPLGTASAQAAGQPAAVPQSATKVQVGFGNRFKLGCWTPVAITLAGKTDSSPIPIPPRRVESTWKLSMAIASRSGISDQPCPRTTAPSTSPTFGLACAGQPIQFRLAKPDEKHDDSLEPLPVPRFDNSPIAVPATNQFIVELATSIGLPEVSRRLNQSDAESTTVVTLNRQQPLPDRWYGYDGVDTVAIACQEFDKAMLTGPAIDALENWVRQGGKLLVCCGDSAAQLLVPVARWLDSRPGNLPAMSICRQPDSEQSKTSPGPSSDWKRRLFACRSGKTSLPTIALNYPAAAAVTIYRWWCVGPWVSAK